MTKLLQLLERDCTLKMIFFIFMEYEMGCRAGHVFNGGKLLSHKIGWDPAYRSFSSGRYSAGPPAPP